MNVGLIAGAIAKAVAILLGVGAVLMMAQEGFHYSFQDDFLRGLEWIEWAVGWVTWPVEELLRIANAYGFRLDLNEHWRQVLVLLWLFNASFTRAIAPLSRMTDLRAFSEGLSRWVWASITAVAGGLLAGTAGLHELAVLWWSVSAFFLTWTGNFFIEAWLNKSRVEAMRGLAVLPIPIAFAAVALGWLPLPSPLGSAAPFWWPVLAWFVLWATGSATAAIFDWSPLYRVRAVVGFSLAAVVALFAVGILPTPLLLMFETSPSPGLANLAAFVVVIAIWFLVLAALFPIPSGQLSGFSQWAVSHPVRSAADILAVLSLAAVLVWLYHVPTP